ncbi:MULTISPECIES: hypothetical protein [Agrobacterium]|uniref:Uncharacterized protein n=1 Tax=Agrobacterium larrymoorei TaxID=160699 RepID=A0AAJ2ETD4_9HYPH|nr:hypothetical protein [Agrobacterium larrymoorei]MDQ1194804.1 hypothetical protein [Rhizobium sp. SORGH_AS_0787]MDR6100227.1 hypothetical protein [Agrobacterium larrymoorei]
MSKPYQRISSRPPVPRSHPHPGSHAHFVAAIRAVDPDRHPGCARHVLGFITQSAAQLLVTVTDIVIPGIAVIAIVAFTPEWLARFIERRIVPWADTSRRR